MVGTSLYKTSNDWNFFVKTSNGWNFLRKNFQSLEKSGVTTAVPRERPQPNVEPRIDANEI
jgi:hypothetical protein